MKFSVDYKIHFLHCDNAGIVFYPQYFNLLSQVVEDWFDHIGVSFTALHKERHHGIPLVRTEVDFLAPSQYGEIVTFELQLKHLGNSSFQPVIEAHCNGEKRLRALYVNVFTHNNDGEHEKVSIPLDIKNEMEKYLIKD
jgi:4-hydroxybenzoyl-CoA thioesterase